MKDGKGKFLFVHFKKAEDNQVPVNRRTGNDEGNQKGNIFIHVREIMNDNLNMRKSKREKMERKESKKSLKSTEKGSKRNTHNGI